MRYYISDLHFYHTNLNNMMDTRGFASAEAMNEYMIQRWNQKVREKDEVVILGDFSVTDAKLTTDILNRLRGRKYLIIGNHDKFLEDKSFDQSLFEWIRPYAELKDNKRKIILSHYPIFCYNGQYQMGKDGKPKTYMLYGHVHNSYDEILVNQFQDITRSRRRMIFHAEEEQAIPCQMINCFCMLSDYQPLTLDEWIEVDEKRRKALSQEKAMEEGE